jgi:hypothetical protein
MLKVKKIAIREGRLILGVVILGSLLFFTGKYFEQNFKAHTYFSARRADMDTLLKGRKDLSSITTDELMKISGLTQDRLALIDRRWKMDQSLIAFFAAARTAGFFILILGYPFCVVINVILGRYRTVMSNRR